MTVECSSNFNGQVAAAHDILLAWFKAEPQEEPAAEPDLRRNLARWRGSVEQRLRPDAAAAEAGRSDRRRAERRRCPSAPSSTAGITSDL